MESRNTARCPLHRSSRGSADPCLAQPSLYLFGNVANPTFREVKANDANRVAVLAFPQIVDDSFKIGVFNVCLAPSTTHSAEIVEDQIDIPMPQIDGDARIVQVRATKVT